MLLALAACVASPARVPTSVVSNPGLVWDETPLDRYLPREGCPYGGTSASECTTGCTVVATITRDGARDASGTRGPFGERGGWVASEVRALRVALGVPGRTHRLVERSDGSVAIDSSITRGDVELTLQVVADRGARTAWLEVALGPDHPSTLGLQARRHRELVERRGQSRFVRVDATQHDERSHHEVRMAPGGGFHWANRWWSRRPHHEGGGWHESARAGDGPIASPQRPPAARVEHDTDGNLVAVEFRGVIYTREVEPVELLHDDAGRVTARRRADGEDRVTRDAEARVVAVDGRGYALDVVRDAGGRVHWEHLVDRRVRRVERRITRNYDEHGRIARSRLEIFGHFARVETVDFTYEGTCDEVPTPPVAGHDLEVEAPLAWW